MDYSTVIKKIRNELGVSQQGFAAMLHLSFSTINRWENGRAKPNRLATVTILSLAEERQVPNELIEQLSKLSGNDCNMHV